MNELRQGLLPFAELDDQQFEAFVLHTLGAGISLSVVEQKETSVGPVIQTVRHQIVRVSRYGPPGPAGQRGIDLLAITGTGAQWAFQCKHYRSPFTPATARKAVAKAETEFPKAQRYFLVLSGEPTPKVRDEVEQRPNWEIWSGSQLSIHFYNEVSRLQQIRILRLVFPVGSEAIITRLYPQHDDFLQSADEFFAPWINPTRLFHHRAQLVGQQHILKELDEFVDNPAAQVFLLPAAGGMGKTRILREFSAQFATHHPGKKLYFADPNARSNTSSDHLRAGMPDELVVVQDDAHRQETLRADLVATLQEIEGKLILATRPQAIESLKAWLGEAGVEYTRIRELPAVKALTRDELLKLATEIAPQASRSQVEQVVQMSRGNALIVTVGAGLVARGELPPSAFVSSEIFRAEVFRRFEDERFAAFSGGMDEAVVKQVLRIVALLAPWNDREVQLEQAAQLADCSARLFQDAIERLRAAELIVQSRNGWRVVPDLFADYLVYHACYDKTGHLTAFARRLQEDLAGSATGTLLRNLAEAEWQALTDGRPAESILSPFWESLLAKFRNGSFFDRTEMIRQWTPFSVLQPERSLMLARQAITLSTTAALPRSALAFGGAYNHGTVLGLLPALLEPIAIYDDHYRKAALDQIWSLFVRGGHLGAEKKDGPLAALGHVATFHPRRPGKAPRAVVDLLAEKLLMPDAAFVLDRPGPALAVILKPIFEHEAEDNVRNGMMLQFRSLPISVKNTHALRERVLEILEKQIIPRGEIATINAIGVLEAAIAMVRPRFGSQIGEQLIAEWLPERRAALAVIGRLVRPDQKPAVLYRIRTLLQNPATYDHQAEFKMDCINILASIPDTFEMRVVRVLLSNAWSEFYRHKISADTITSHEDLKRSEEQWTSFSVEVARRVIDEHPQALEMLGWLEETVDQLQAVGYSPQPHNLIFQITHLQPEFAAECLDLLLKQSISTLDDSWVSWFVGERKLPEGRVQQWLEAVFNGANRERWRNALGILRWAGIGDLTPDVLDAVSSWARRLRDDDLTDTVESLRWRGKRDQILDNMILLNLPLEHLADASLVKLAHALGQSLGDETAAPLPLEFERNFLEQLLRMKTLSDPQAEDFLRGLAKRFPRDFYEILQQRIERAGSHRLPRYEPLPYWDDFSLVGLSETDGYPSLAQRLFERYLSSVAQPVIWWQRLFQMAVMAVSSLGLELVRESLPNAADEEALIRLIQTLGYEGSNVIFTAPDLVRTILHKIDELAPQSVGKLRFALAHSGAPRIRSFKGSEVGPEARHYREQAAKSAAIYESDALLGAFYREIIRGEDAAEARHREWVEMELTEWS